MLDSSTLSGTWTALATPFTHDSEQIDYQSLENLIEFQIDGKADGLVLCGSTAEANLLSEDEFRGVIQRAVSIVNKRVPLIGCIGSSNTRHAGNMAEWMSTAGLQGIMVVTPPYVKPSQSGIKEHFKTIAGFSKVPLVAYNIPGRAAANMTASTIADMFQSGHIIGVKEATGSLDQVLDIFQAAEGLSILSGECSLVHSIMSTGGKGTISATANLIPAHFSALTSAALSGDFATSLKLQVKALPLIRAVFCETNPVPVKAGLAMKNIIKSDAVRLPLLSASEETRARLRECLI